MYNGNVHFGFPDFLASKSGTCKKTMDGLIENPRQTGITIIVITIVDIINVAPPKAGKCHLAWQDWIMSCV